MSQAYTKGKNFELKIASMMRKKLDAAIYRDKRSGAGTNRADLTDYYQETPLHIECKSQENIKIQEWFRQADAAASFTKAPTVVFAVDEEILATLRFSDLLNFLVEITDLRAEIDDLRAPVIVPPGKLKVPIEEVRAAIENKPAPVYRNIDQITHTCKEGHIADEYGYCQQKTCKYSRGYKTKKKEKK